VERREIMQSETRRFGGAGKKRQKPPKEEKGDCDLFMTEAALQTADAT
jgi:hypothetical protein